MPKSKRIYTKSRQSARLLNRNRENMTVPMKHNIWTCCNGTDPVRHAKTTSWTYRRRGRIPVMDSSSEPMAQARTVLGIQPVPAIHFDAKRKEQVERLKNLLLNSPGESFSSK